MGDKTLEEDSADEKLDYNLQTQNFSSLSGSASNICWVNIKVNYFKLAASTTEVSLNQGDSLVRSSPPVDINKSEDKSSKYLDGESLPVTFDTMNVGARRVRSTFGCFGGLISLLSWILEDFRYVTLIH